MEAFAKHRVTMIMCSDSPSCKLRFAIDSRLRGNDVFEGYEIDGRFCKGLFIGIRLNLWLTHKLTA